MQVSVESVGNLERRMTLRVPADSVEGQVGGRLREIARTARIKGFRPGKVPATVIEQRFGAQVRGEILDDLLQEGFERGVRENELRIAGAPRIEPSAEAGEGEMAFVASFEIVPDFGDIDVTKLQVVRHTSDVTEDDIDRMIENLRLQRRSWTLVTRPAQSGDAVDLETWSVVDGERLPPEGAERGVTVIGTGGMYPEIENALIGMSAGRGLGQDRAGFRSPSARRRRRLHQELRREVRRAGPVPRRDPQQPRARAQGRADEPPPP
jgi:trigger factor